MRPLALLCVLAACSGDDSSSGSHGWQLRPGVVPVYAGYAQADCSTGVCEQPDVLDVDVDGARIAVLRVVGLQSAQIDLSDDDGATWRHVTVAKNLVDQLNWNTHGLAVHLEHGNVYLLLANDQDQLLAYWRDFQIDETTGAPTEIALSAFARSAGYLVRRPDGRIREVLIDRVDIDPATGQVDQVAFDCGGPDHCDGLAYRTRDGGDTYDAFTAGTDSQECHYHYDAATNTPSTTCVAGGSWPAHDTTHLQPHLLFGAGTDVWKAWADLDNHQVYASAITGAASPQVTAPIALGPGVAFSSEQVGFGPRPRWGAYVLVEAVAGGAGIGHLVTLDAAGAPQQVNVPLSPCVDDAGCGYEGGDSFGYADVQWIQPRAGGDTLVFYLVNNAAVGTQNTLYIEHQTPTTGAVAGAVAYPVWMPPTTLPNSPQFMTPLETACARIAGCVGAGTDQIFRACLDRYSTQTPTYPGRPMVRARLEADAEADCTTLQADDPEAFGVSTSCSATCTETGGNCNGGTCSTEVAYDATACNTCDATNHYRTCAGGAMYATTCQAACTDGVGCTNSGTCTASCFTGTLLQTCPATGTYVLTACDATGNNQCVDQSGTPTCEPVAASDCNPAEWRLACIHQYAASCVLGQIQIHECTRCTDTPTGGICTGI